jgi:hypothetical protein
MSHQRPLAQPDQHQAVYGCEHRLDHMAPDALPIRAEQPVAQSHQLDAESGAVAKQKKQGQKGEAE